MGVMPNQRNQVLRLPSAVSMEGDRACPPDISKQWGKDAFEDGCADVLDQYFPPHNYEERCRVGLDPESGNLICFVPAEGNSYLTVLDAMTELTVHLYRVRAIAIGDEEAEGAEAEDEFIVCRRIGGDFDGWWVAVHRDVRP